MNGKLVEEFNTSVALTTRTKFGIYCLGFGSILLISGLTDILGVVSTAAALGGWNRVALLLLAGLVLTPVLHEGMHGLFFWVFSRKANFGIQLKTWMGLVFWASSFGSLIPRVKFQIIALAPQILTVVFLLVIIFASLPNTVNYVLLLISALNLGGGCFDIYGVTWLQHFPKYYLVEDTKEGCRIFAPQRGGK